MDVVEAAAGWTLRGLFDQPEGAFAEGYGYEVLDGHLLVTPPPLFGHQDVERVLFAALLRAEVAPWRTYVESYIDFGEDGRRPDLVVVDARLNPAKRDPGFLPQAVGLVVEVVSRTSRKTDRILKPAEYAASGIPIYWRVEQEPEVVVHAFRLVDGAYVATARVDDRGTLPAPWGDVVVDLAELA